MSELFERRLIHEYPAFYCGLGFWAVALLVVVATAVGVVSIKRQRTAVIVTLVAVMAPLVAIVSSPGASLFAVYLMVAAVPSALVAFVAGLVAGRRLRDGELREARGHYGRNVLIVGLFVVSVVAALLYTLATMTIRF
jgi:hypothetical protein